MKNKALLFLLVLAMASLPVLGQDADAGSIDLEIRAAERELAALRVRYTDEYVKVIEKRTEIENLKRIKRLLSEELVLPDPLPNDQVKLLQMIVVQNDQIIRLLRSLIPRPEG